MSKAEQDDMMEYYSSSDINNNNVQQDYETDYTFCHESEHSKDDDSKLFNPMPLHANLEGGRRKRKTKTIFSLDVTARSRPASTVLHHHQPGAGAFGDGGDDIIDTKQDKLDGNKDNQLKNFRKCSIDKSDLCKIKLPYNKKSTLILSQPTTVAMASLMSNAFTATFQLENPTAFKQAFKIYCNYSALNNFTVSPRSGVIPPHGQISIRVKTKRDLQTEMEVVSCCDHFTVKFFPAYFDGNSKDSSEAMERRLIKFLKMLSEQCPDLIQEQTIRRVFLWTHPSNGKPALHRYSTEFLSKIKKLRRLRSAQIQIQVATQAWRKFSHWLHFFQSILDAGGFLGTCAFLVLYVMPFLSTDAVVAEENTDTDGVEEISWWLPSYFQNIVNPFF